MCQQRPYAELIDNLVDLRERDWRKRKPQRLRCLAVDGYPGITTIRKPLFMHRKTYSALLTKLRHIETNPESRKYKSKRLTERTIKPTNMYQVEVAHIADV